MELSNINTHPALIYLICMCTQRRYHRSTNVYSMRLYITYAMHFIITIHLVVMKCIFSVIFGNQKLLRPPWKFLNTLLSRIIFYYNFAPTTNVYFPCKCLYCDIEPTSLVMVRQLLAVCILVNRNLRLSLSKLCSSYLWYNSRTILAFIIALSIYVLTSQPNIKNGAT